MRKALVVLGIAVYSTAAFAGDFVVEENRGQADAAVRFIGRTGAFRMGFSKAEVLFCAGPGQTLGLRFEGEAEGSVWEPLDPLPSSSSYFIGNNPDGWIRAIPHFRRLIRRGIYPGIDVVFYGSGDRVEYDFRLAAGADPGAIRMKWRGSEGQALAANGDLEVRSEERNLVLHSPVLYQQKAGRRVPVSGRFRISPDGSEAGFEVGPYDSAVPLTIDPTVNTVQFLGGAGNDRITALGPVTAGVTNSALFNPFGSQGSGNDVFVWDGQNYSVYGGSGDEEPTAVINVPNYGNVVVGWTSSRDFPFIGSRSFQPVYGGGNSDGFILVATVNAPLSSYLGGSGDDRILSAVLDPTSLGPSGSIAAAGYVLAGETTSPDFPAVNALQPALAGGKDGFITRIGSNGGITESTYWGGSGDDSILSIDAASTYLWFAGRTNSPDLRTAAPLQSQLAGLTDGFLGRLTISAAAAPSQLDFATYYGGSGDDEIRSVKIGPDSWIRTGGNTTSSDLPVIQPSQSAIAGDMDAWIGRFHPTQFTPSFVTYFGGSGHDELTALAFDWNGDLYAGGFTSSSDLPVQNAFQYQPGGGTDGFIARFDSNGQPWMATYAGGTGDDRIRALLLNSDGSITAGGESDSPSLPSLQPAGSVAAVNAGQLDGMLIVLHEDGIFAAPLTLGVGMIATLNLKVTGAQNLSLPVTVTSTDPTRLLVAGAAFSTAVPGTYTSSFSLQALASSGVVNLIVSAPGLTPRTVPVTLAPTWLVNPYTAPISILLNSGAYPGFSFATANPVTGDPIYGNLAPGIDPAVSFVSADTTVAESLLSYNSVQQTVSANLRGVGVGSTTVAIVSPVFPLRGQPQLSVQVASSLAPVFLPPNIAVGQMMETTLPLNLSAASPAVMGNPTVTLTSMDSSRLLLSLSPGTIGSASISMLYVSSYGQAPVVWVQGRSLTGTVQIRVDTQGAAPVYVSVAVAPSSIAIATPLETLNYYAGVHHNPDNTSVTENLWSTRTLFALTAQIAGIPPAGFTVRDQLPVPDFGGSFLVDSSDHSVIPGPWGVTFDEAQGTAYALFGLPYLKPGTTTLTVSANGYASAPPLQITLLPSTLPFSKTDLTLGKGLETAVYFDPAYDFPSGVQVTVTSGDPSRVLVSANQIDEGATASVAITQVPTNWFWVSALADSGDVPVTVQAPGYGSRTMTVHLAPTTFGLSPATLTATIGDYALVNITWSYPNQPTGYVTTLVRQKTNYSFAVAVSDSSILQNQAPQVTFQGYYGNLTLVSLSTGTSTVSLTSTSDAVVDPNQASATVTVVPKPSFISPATAPLTVVLGKDLQRPLITTNGAPLLNGVTFTSNDPSKVLLSSDSGLPGSATVTSKAGTVYAQALADSGDVTVVARSPGYADGTITVRLLPTAFGFYDPYSSPVVTGSIGTPLSLRVAPVAIDSASGNPVALTDASLRAGLAPFNVALTNSDSSVGSLLSPIAFIGGLSQNTSQFRPVANGVTSVAAVAPAGYVDGGAALQRTIRIAPPELALAGMTIGKDMELTAQVNVLNPGASSPATLPAFTVTSSDSSRVLVSASSTALGGGSAFVAGSNIFYVQALAANGDVPVSVSASGYAPVTANVHLEPSYFTFTQGTSLGVPNPLSAIYGSPYSLGLYLVHPSYVYPANEALRPGAGPVTVTIESSNPTVIPSTSVVFPVGAQQAGAPIIANTGGSTNLLIDTPPGFSTAPDAYRTQPVNVSLRSFNLFSTSAGQDRSVGLNYSPGGVSQAVSIHFTSSDPSLVLLSADPKGAGSSDLTVTLAPQAVTPTVYVFGLAAGGSPTISATGNGFAPATASVILSPSGFAFQNSQVTLAAGQSATVRVQTLGGQPLRGGISPVTVSINNGNSAVAQAGTAVFQPGDSYEDIPIRALSSGQALLTILDKSGAPTSSVFLINVP